MDARSAATRFLDSPALSAATRRTNHNNLEEFCTWLGNRDLETVDVRVLVDYTGWLGTSRSGRGKLAPASIGRKLVAGRSFLRPALGPDRLPDARLAPKRPRRLPAAPQPAEVGP